VELPFEREVNAFVTQEYEYRWSLYLSERWLCVNDNKKREDNI